MRSAVTHIGLGLVIFLSLFLSSPIAASARNLAYLFDDGDSGIVVRTFDTDTEAIIAKRTLPQLKLGERDEWKIVASPVDNLLFVMYSRGRGDFRIAVFDFTTLAFKRELDAVSPNRPWMLVPPKTSYFFLHWFDPVANGGQGAERMTRYEKATLNKIEHVPDVPFRLFGAENVFSVDGQRIYSYTTSDASIVRIFATQTLQLVSTVDVPAMLSPNRWGEGIEDVKDDRVLLAENHKVQRVDPNRYSLFTLRLTDQVRSPKIETGLEGESRLTPSGDRVVFQETTTVLASDGTVKAVEALGRLHVYDVASGAKLGQIVYQIAGQSGGTILAIRPQGDKVYVSTDDPVTDAERVGIISLSTFSLVKELTLEPIRAIVFFER